MKVELDSVPDISAVGSALVALESEIAQLEREAEQHQARMKLCLTKMEVCRATISRLLTDACGSYPKPAPDARFPELN